MGARHGGRVLVHEPAGLPGAGGTRARGAGAVALVCAGVAWFKIRSSKDGKLLLREQLLDQLALQGDEKVLDVGCGRGLLAIGAAKRLKTGKVTGIDVWNPQDLSGNSADSAKENAKAEGVADRVRFESGDARKLVYPENHYDVVVSANALHTLAGRSRAGTRRCAKCCGF